MVRLSQPRSGAVFSGYNATVTLEWSSERQLGRDEYYVICIPYGSRENSAQIAGIGEFWRPGKSFEVPKHYHSTGGGFPNRLYKWSVQAMRCIENCDKALNDEVRKRGEALGPRSEEWTFFWHPDPDMQTPTPTPEKT